MTNDPYFPNMTALQQIKVPEAWDLTTGSPSVEIVQLDTGFTPHPDLTQNVVGDGQFAFNAFGVMEAGIIAATPDNAVGIVGVCHQVRLWCNRAIWSDRDLAVALDLAIAQHPSAKVCFIGHAIVKNKIGPELVAAIGRWSNGGARIIVCPVGDNFASPLNLSGKNDARLLAVGAMNPDGSPWFASNRGAQVDVWAPYHTTTTLSYGTGYGTQDSTRVAAALVAGVAGLMVARNPAITGAEIQQKILATADPFGGLKRVNAHAAVIAAAL